jgi:ubiquinol-cytochrome c reductase cytochrome c subunit
VLLLSLAALALAYSGLAPRAESAPGQESFAVTKGRELYTVSCSSCHGLNGQGGSEGPSLIGVGGAAVDFQVSTGRMPLQANQAQAPRKKPAFTQDEIDAMAAFVASLGSGPAQATMFEPGDTGTPDGDLAAGGQLFLQNCAQCHNFAGSGGALTQGKYAPKLEGVSNRNIYQAMLTGPQNMPVFGDEQLSSDEKISIITYIRHTEAQADPGGFGLGRIGPVPEGLVAWVVGIGALVLITVWIGAKAK